MACSCGDINRKTSYMVCAMKRKMITSIIQIQHSLNVFIGVMDVMGNLDMVIVETGLLQRRSKHWIMKSLLM